MLGILRDNTRSFIIYLLFGIIIIVFVFTFNTITPDQACGSAGPAGLVADLASVGSERIDTNMLDVASRLTLDPPSPKAQDPRSLQRRFTYRNTRFLRLGLGGAFQDFGPDPGHVSPIKVEKAMSDLVESVLVASAARATGLDVSDKELTDRLINDDWFDDAGQFRRDDYNNFVRFQIGTSNSRFEEFVRNEILRERMITMVVGGVRVSGSELAFHHAAENETVDLSIVVLDDDVAGAMVAVTPEEVATWSGANAEAIKSYFEKNTGEFNKPERFAIRGIQIKAANRALIALEKDEDKRKKLEEERVTARTRADGVLAGLLATAAAQAPTKADKKKKKGKKAKKAKKAEAAADAAAKTPSPIVPVEAFAKAVTDSSDHSATKEIGGVFNEPRSHESLGRWPFGEEVADAVAALEPGQVTALVEVDSGFWIMRLDSKLAAETRTLEEASAGIAEALVRRERAAAFKGTLADELLAEAKKDPKRSLEDVAGVINAKYGVTEEKPGIGARATGPFSRLQAGAFGAAAKVGYVPGVGEAADLVGAAFKASQEAPLLEQVFSVAGGKRLIVARLIEHSEAGEMDADGMTALSDRLLREKQKLFYRSWYLSLLKDGVESGSVDFTDEWKGILQASIDLYRDSGGVLTPVGEPQAATP
jgi:peptidyl-prolyl cis-trans isomerase D